jgi:hypothetical protein
LQLVVASFEVSHFPGGPLGRLRIALAVSDGERTETPARNCGQRSFLSMAIPDRHALQHLSELAGDDISRHQRKLRAGGLVDPDDPTLERLIEGRPGKDRPDCRVLPRQGEFPRDLR